MEGKRSPRSTKTSQAEKTVVRSVSTSVNGDKFNVLYTNADCFSNKRQDLCYLLSTLNYKPSVIVITEVNSKIVCNNLSVSEYNLLGFTLYSVNVAVNNKRGIIVYVDSDLSSSCLDSAEEFVEALFIKIKDISGNLITLGAFYRSPNSTVENDNKLISLLDSLKSFICGKLLLVGDFNFPNINWLNYTVINNSSINSSAYKFITCLNNNFLTQHVLFPTRARGSQTPHTLDLFISNDDFVEDVVNLSPLGKSDHSVLLCVCSFFSNNTVNVSKLNYSKGNYKGLCNHFSNTFDKCYYESCLSITDSWTYLKSVLGSGMLLYIPHVESNAWRRKKSWQFPIDNSFKKLINKKHRCWTRFQESKDKKYLNEFKHIRNLVRKQSREASQKIQSDVAKTCKSNPKKFWQYVRSKTTTSSGMGDIRVMDSNSFKIISNDSEKAEVFSEYFSKLYTVESDTNFVALSIVLPQTVMPPIIFYESQVADKLHKLKLNKSPGPDMLHPRVLYEIKNELVSPLTFLFNKSLNSAVLPEEWKSSLVSVLHKKGKKDSIENYRPISLTCICCKIMESIVRDYVMDYFMTNQLFSDKQYGFIRGRSTVLQLLKVADDWVRSLDEGSQVDIIYTDFEKAFDKVPHQRLISKLYAYGVNIILVKWIEAFLICRIQRVRINGEISGSKPVLSGIPQGSVLGPLLFVIFINDLPLACEDLSKMYLFADDAKLYKCIKDLNDFNCLNQSANAVFAWSDSWLMKLNILKCKVLSICRNSNNIVKYNYGFEVPNQGYISLDHEVVIKDLGVWMDSNLSYDDHIYEKIKTANMMLGIIRRNFINLDRNSLVLLYKGMVRSHLEYAGSVWSPHKKSLIRDIENIQKRATKLIHACKNMSYRERLFYLQLPTLRYRRLRGDMIEVFKILSGMYDAQVVPIIERNLDTRNRGNSLKLRVERCNYDVRKYSFCNRIVNVWNSLPDNVVKSSSLNVFKNNLDKHWKFEAFYYDFEANFTGFYY